MGQIESSSPFLPLPEGIVIVSIQQEDNLVHIHITCRKPRACCPSCRSSSERVHGTYKRTVADLPCAGRRVLLHLLVRKFVCGNLLCAHSIFTERLDELVHSYARMTNRLSETLQTVGFATCGELGERLAPKLGMHASGPTILRHMRTRLSPSPEVVSIVGIDDWAWRKGTTYGTILVDLERHKVIELLPDRSAETAEAWLQAHPEIQLVSRDRGGDYAAAARRGAPQAEQAADPFHLIKNLRESLKDLMVRYHSHLPEVEARGSDAIPAKAQGRKSESEQQEIPGIGQTTEAEKHYRSIPASPYQRPERESYSEAQKQMRREKRQGLYETVHALASAGMSQREITRTLDLARETVSKFLHAQEYPEMHHRKRREKSSILDPYRGYILERWQQGCRNSVQLYDEITARGFKGSAPLLRIFLAELRKKHREAASAQTVVLDTATQSVPPPPEIPPKPRITHRMSPSSASWLFIRQIEDLGKQQKQHIEHIRMVHPELEVAYQLTQNFVLLLLNRQAQDLDAWLTQAESSSLPELKRFAKGIRRDYDAVRTACSTSWSQGQVEAQVNCLKLQKRIVYGRANFDLLRLRVLCRV